MKEKLSNKKKKEINNGTWKNEWNKKEKIKRKGEGEKLVKVEETVSTHTNVFDCINQIGVTQYDSYFLSKMYHLI